MKFIAILLTALLALSCKRTVSPTDENSNTLAGKWKLTEFVMDPGNGTGTWQPATSQTYIQFNGDGTMSSNMGIFGDYTRYEMQTDSSLVISKPPSSTIFFVSFKITGNMLELNPTCIERCGFKFKRQ